MIKKHLLNSKTKYEMERDFNKLENYFLNDLTGEINNSVSCYSIEFMNDLNNFNNNQNKEKIKNSFFRLILEKSVSKYYTVKEMLDIVLSIEKNNIYSNNLLKIKIKELKNLYKNKSLEKSKYLQFIKLNNEEEVILNSIYKTPKKLIKELNVFLKNIEYQTLKTFNVNIQNVLTKSYFLTIGRLNEQIYLSKKEEFLDFDESMDFFHNCSNYIPFFDGFNFLNFNELLNILCSNDLIIDDKYKNNLFIGFYLIYLKPLFINNKNFMINYNLYSLGFKENFTKYYSKEFYEQIEKRFDKWNSFLNIYNEGVNKINHETSWGLLLFLSKEFIFELNRLILLIFKMNFDPMKISNIIEK